MERYYGEIHGLLFRDDNPNGILDIREPGLPGKAVYLDSNDNGQLDPGELTAVTSQDDPSTADVNEAGSYSFFGVPPGVHRVAPVIEQSWEQTFREPRVKTERVSIASDGAQASGEFGNAISADGQLVAFVSSDSNLTLGDTNESPDIFIRNHQTEITERVSVATNRVQSDWVSYSNSISGDGRYVAFKSAAGNLAPGDTVAWDIFIHDRSYGITEQIRVAANDSSPSISDDGRYVVFRTDISTLAPGDTNGTWDIFVYDRTNGITERVSVASDGSQANNRSDNPSISADGRFVAFRSDASNLIPEDTNGKADIFVHDRQTKNTQLLTVAFDSSQATQQLPAEAGRFGRES